MASWARRLALAALFFASVLGVVVLVRDRMHAHTPDARLPELPSSIPAPAPSVVRAPQLEGRILASNGDAVRGAHVRVISSAHAVAETETDFAGHFAFDRLSNGRVRVEADHDPEGAIESADVSISNVTTHLTLVLAPAGIAGQVVDGVDGHAIAGASLSVDGVPFAVAGVTSDGAGAFRFAAVPFEATSVVAVASGYRSSRVVLEPREDRPEP
ncbi:MAG: carboxypeptidase regulatory-like domain-containing protein, partial [Polyangiaceae bacterium]